MLAIGVGEIRNTIQERANLLYDLVEKHPYLSISVKDEAFRSPTVIVTNVAEGAPPLLENWQKEGVIVGNGYGKMKGKQVRFANFPSNTDSEFEKLLGLLEKEI